MKKNNFNILLTELIHYDIIISLKKKKKKSSRWAQHSSVDGDYRFTKTKSFDEATELFRNGWQTMSEKLTKRMKAEEVKPEYIPLAKTTIGVQGYQPVVPLYLMGIPNNMVTKKVVPQKKKVITINKNVTFSGCITTDVIEESNLKVLRLVNKLEAQNYRVNLNVVIAIGQHIRDDKGYIIKIRLKKASEKLNINKLAFSLAHPSMLRRLFFRWEEVYPDIPTNYRHGYGIPINQTYLKNEYFKDEYFISNIIECDIEKIKDIKDLEKI